MPKPTERMTLAKYLKLNYDPSMEQHPDSQEFFICTICDYLSSFDYRSCDSKYLKRNGLRKADFS